MDGVEFSQADGEAPPISRLDQGLRCEGRGSIRIDLQPFGSVESPCRASEPSEGGYVLSDLSSGTTRWQVNTAAGNRWSLVLTQPLAEGGSWSP